MLSAMSCEEEKIEVGELEVPVEGAVDGRRVCEEDLVFDFLGGFGGTGGIPIVMGVGFRIVLLDGFDDEEGTGTGASVDRDDISFDEEEEGGMV